MNEEFKESQKCSVTLIISGRVNQVFDVECEIVYLDNGMHFVYNGQKQFEFDFDNDKYTDVNIYVRINLPYFRHVTKTMSKLNVGHADTNFTLELPQVLMKMS